MSTLRDLAAGVICIGFDGTAIDDPLRRRLASVPLAGLILFGRNIEDVRQTRALTDEIRAMYSNPIIAIDQEGGRVARLRRGTAELPSMMALAATSDVTLAEHAGEQLAFDLLRAGVNVDFAPVLDLALFAGNTVIGARSFGDDPHRVAELAGAFAKGLERHGILATFKHFPGHGATEVDSHLDLPRIDASRETLEARDFVPFAALLPHAGAVMTAHIVVQALDRNHPATTSQRILTQLLRTQMHFEGVCFTDCMQMDAIAKGIGSAQGAAAALAAGADCVLISRDFDVAQASIDAITDAVETGDLPESRLREAYARVQRLRLGLHQPLELDAVAPYADIGREIGRRAVTLLRGAARADAGSSVVVTFEGTTIEGVQGLHSDHALLQSAVPVEQRRLALEPDDGELSQLIAELGQIGKRPIVIMRRAHVYARQMDAVARIVQEFPDALVVSAREPFDAFALPQARHVLCIYGDDAPSLAGLADVVFGGAPAQGRLPVRSAHDVARR